VPCPPDQPAVAVHFSHVVRRQKNGVIAFRIEFAVSAIDDARFRQDGAAFGLEILDDEFVLNRLGIRSGCLRVREQAQGAIKALFSPYPSQTIEPSRMFLKHTPAWECLAAVLWRVLEPVEDGFHGAHAIDIRVRRVVPAALTLGQSKPAPGKFIAGTGAAKVYHRREHLLVLQCRGADSVALQDVGDAAVEIS